MPPAGRANSHPRILSPEDPKPESKDPKGRARPMLGISTSPRPAIQVSLAPEAKIRRTEKKPADSFSLTKNAVSAAYDTLLKTPALSLSKRDKPNTSTLQLNKKKYAVPSSKSKKFIHSLHQGFLRFYQAWKTRPVHPFLFMAISTSGDKTKLDLFLINLSELKLPDEINRLLRYSGMESVGELVQMKERALLSLPFFQEKHLEKLKTFLKDHGLSLNMTLKDIESVDFKIPESRERWHFSEDFPNDWPFQELMPRIPEEETHAEMLFSQLVEPRMDIEKIGETFPDIVTYFSILGGIKELTEAVVRNYEWDHPLFLLERYAWDLAQTRLVESVENVAKYLNWSPQTMHWFFFHRNPNSETRDRINLIPYLELNLEKIPTKHPDAEAARFILSVATLGHYLAWPFKELVTEMLGEISDPRLRKNILQTMKNFEFIEME